MHLNKNADVWFQCLSFIGLLTAPGLLTSSAVMSSPDGRHSASDEVIMESDDGYSGRRASGCGQTGRQTEQLCASCR